MADAWGGAWGSAWGVSWGQTATTGRGSAGGGRTWAPEPERPRTKSQVRKIEKKIEQIAQQPIARIDMASLSMAVQRMLAIEIPDYSQIVWLAQQRIEARRRSKEEQDRSALAAIVAEQAEAEAAIEAQMLAIERTEQMRLQKRKANLTKKRDRNKQLIMQMLKWH